MIEIGKVIPAMKPEYAIDMEAILKEHDYDTWAELKYDGYRFQLHKKGDVISAFTYNQNSIPLDTLPELNSSIKNLPDCILDCELNGGIGHSGFKKVKSRFRHRISNKRLEDYLISGIVDEMPMELKVFDTLYWEGIGLIEMPLRGRREYTEKIDEKKITPSRKWEVRSVEELQNIFDEVTGEKHEGLVCKDPRGIYIPDGRGNGWYKLKKFETLDLLILGAYINNDAVSQFLCGSYNDQTNKYESLGVVNAKREGIGEEAYGMIGSKFRKKRPRNVLTGEKITEPDFYLAPSDSLVLEVRAMNLNFSRNNKYMCGYDGNKSYSMRIAWAYGIRDTKKAKQSTTTKEIAKLYRLQEEK